MIMDKPFQSAPDTTLGSVDPGDETARRFRYQWTYAAIVCCQLLDDIEDAEEVFCEHHEDVLIKHTDQTFSALQVKTRSFGQELWRATDRAVKRSCARFAQLEASFPGEFRNFHFLTNYPLRKGNNTQDLCKILATIGQANASDQLPASVLRFVRQVACEAKCDEKVAFAALSKTNASDDLPELRYAETSLVQALTEVWPRADDCSFASVRKAAQALINECGQASSLAHEQSLPQYLAATTNPEKTALDARIAGKRIDSSRLTAILEDAVDSTAQLFVDPEFCTEPGTGQTTLLMKKLDAGGFSAVSRHSAKDLRDKADYLGRCWTLRHGRESGLQRYEHVRSLVLSDAADAYEAAQRMGRVSGPQMLAYLRSKFKERRENNGQLYDCSDEHLAGFAYSLTSQCKIHWSSDSPWEDE